MTVLFLPLIQEHLNISKIRPLAGDYVPAPDVELTRKTWLNKRFQEKKDSFLHDNFGYHNTYVRIHNQIVFSLFKKAKANGVVVGKDNYLYEERYISAYYGNDFIGIDSIKKKMFMVKFLADTLKKQNKTFFIVFAPGKAAYFPEYIPENKKMIKGITNIEVYSQLARELKIPHIDFHSWFIQNKNKSKYPLVPKYGIHWSFYGSALAADSILKTIEMDRNINVPDMNYDEIRIEKGKNTDIDIENGMNLLYRLKPENLAYPEVKFPINLKPGETKPSVLVIADSYYWQIYSMGISNIFDRSDFWYYFKSAHSTRYEKSKKIEEVDIIDEVNQHNVIIIMSTDVHLANFGWNFIETLFGYYNGVIPRTLVDPTFSKKINKAMKDIRQDEVWFKEIQEKAARKKIPVDSMLYLDAQWVVNEEMKAQNSTKK